MKNNPRDRQFALLGLGRFGMGLLEEFHKENVSVLVCDQDAAKVHQAAALATHVVQMDFAQEENLESIGIGNFDVVVVAAGDDFEGSLMATSIAKEKGAGFLLVKAQSYRQQKILLSAGADRVILPELEMGAKVARGLLGTNVMDVLADSEHYSIAEMPPMGHWVGKTVAQSNIRAKHGLHILGIRRGRKTILPVNPAEVLQAGDVLIVLDDSKQEDLG